MPISRNGTIRTTIAIVWLLFATAVASFGYVFTGVSWHLDTVNMQLALGRSSVGLQDGAGSWNNAAAQVLALWNEQLPTVQFAQVETTTTVGYGGDGTNTAFFSNTAFGQSFGSNTLAVTIWRYNTSNPGVTTEADVIFNNAKRFDSYRGPIQHDSRTGAAVYDFQRVALHEFGHVLGLDHPDEHGQSGREALMNSIISDLDHLADDDIAGAQALYIAKITSQIGSITAPLGMDFSYQIRATNRPTSFAATGLPAGLVLDTTTGLISGIPTAAGYSQLRISATGPSGTVSADIWLSIAAPRITSSWYATADLGLPFSYSTTADNNPISFSADPLPPGLQINGSTGVISGTPTTTGNFSVTLSATGRQTTATAQLSIRVEGPSITSSQYVYVQVGSPFSYTITATRNPTSFEASDLPAGLQLDGHTGAITGTPSVVGNYDVPVVAHCSVADATTTLHIAVNAPTITSYASAPATVGGGYSFQVTASNNPTSFSATGLPAGLTIDPATGAISGIATLSGTYDVRVVAHGAVGDAVGTVRITVNALGSAEDLVASFQIPYGTIVPDPQRDRLYVTGPNQLSVIDTASLAIVATVAGTPYASDASISADGSRLWMLSYNQLMSVDLNTLAVSAPISMSAPGFRVREGLNQRLYVAFSDGSIAVVNSATGAVETRFTPSAANVVPFIEIAPDRRTLYCATPSYPNVTVARYDISAATPVLQQTITQAGTAAGLALSRDGQHLCIVPDSYAASVFLRSVSDLSSIDDSFVVPNDSVGSVAFTFDGTALFAASHYSSPIYHVDLLAHQVTKAMLRPGLNNASGMALDRTGTYLFVPGSVLQVYRVRPRDLPAPQPHSVLNVSTRLSSLPGENALIGGFIITGSATKRVVVRAIGPSLPVTGKLDDPAVQLWDGEGRLIAANDNWNATRAAVLATGLQPSDEHEAAVISDLPPGSYTATVSGVDGASGVALVEVYDLSPQLDSTLANISTRGFVGLGDDVMIGGFIVGGDESTRVVIRAIGPSLADSIPGALLNPTLEVYDGNGTLTAENDDWKSGGGTDVAATGIAPAYDAEAAIVATLPPGSYTAVVRGQNETTGVALVEVYNLD